MAAEEYRWERVESRDEQWVLVDPNGRIARQVLKLGPYLGKPDPVYRLFLDEDYTDHASLDEAMAAAESTLG